MVTYTRAATAELRDRIRKRLEAALRHLLGEQPVKASDPLADLLEGRGRADAELLRAALIDFDRAPVLTIHGFAQRVLQELAFETGEPFEIELMEDERPTLDDVYTDFIARRFHALPLPVAHALELSEKQHDDLRTFARTVYQRASAPLPDPVPPNPDVGEALDGWHRARLRARETLDVDHVHALITAPGMNGRSYPARPMRAHLESVASWSSPREVDTKLLRKLSSGNLKTNKGHDAPEHPFFDAALEWLEAHEPLETVLECAHYRLRYDLARFVREEMGRRLEERGAVTFDGLLRKVAAGLERSSTLADTLRARYRAALIDEFQDTDPLQYRIFRRVFDGLPLFLIGDPKQAIYAFRGADVFAYLEAAEDAGAAVASLARNYRSDPAMLRAVETLFGLREDPFELQAVQFTPVEPRAGARDAVMNDPLASAAMQIFTHEGMEGSIKELSVSTSARLIARALSSDMELLEEHETEQGKEWRSRSVKAADFAVLCRTNSTALAVQDALRLRGIAAVFRGDKSVFSSATASDLLSVLVATLEPHALAALRAALLTPLCGVSADALLADEGGARTVEHARRFLLARSEWRSHGIMRALRFLFDRYEVEHSLLRRWDGERRLTDLLHLAELLHRAEHERGLGPERLTDWFHKSHTDPSEAESTGAADLQMRLESDDAAVQLFTIHTSKGLEFPFVLCPDLYAAPYRPAANLFPREYHQAGSLQLEFALPSDEAALDAARREYDAENRRLLYVALTRAKHRVYIPWGRGARSFAHSPLAALLHPEGVEDDAALVADVDRLVERSQGSVARIDAANLGDATLDGSASEELPRSGARKRTRDLHQRRVLTSYSAWVKEANEAHFAGRDIDRAIDVEHARAPLLPSLPAGAATGLLVHSVLEEVALNELEGLEAVIREALQRFGQPEHYAPEIDAAVRATARARLDLGDGLSASLGEATAGIAEMEIMLPFEPRADWHRTLVPVMRREGGLFARYADALETLSIGQVDGFLRGFIDWAGELAGRAIVVDYKSNLLAGSDYGEEALEQAMIDHHYPVQALVYLLALRRHLARVGMQLPSGGAHYLFLRGLGRGGISSLHPSDALLATFENVFFAGEGR